MNWRLRLAILLCIGLPVLAGLPQRWLSGTPIAGLSRGMVGAFAAAHLFLPLLIGVPAWIRTLSAAALITVPVIAAGVMVSALFFLTGLSVEALAAVSPHYLRLAVNMLTVIPLTLAMVATVPWNRLELRLLQKSEGVTGRQKAMLMTVRVFSHIFATVLPQTMEVLREEGRGRGAKALADQMAAVGVAGICAALRFIGLWAVEIGGLPKRKTGRGQG
jgi:hypothetical protein